MSTINDVKNKIKEKLDTLVPASLGTVVISDIRQDPLDVMVDQQSFPVALIMPPAITNAERETNREIIRDVTYVVMVVLKMDDVTNTSQVEDLMETLLNLFDNSITLDNVSVGGLVPTTSFPEPFIHNSRSFILFDIIIKARVLQDLTFS